MAQGRTVGVVGAGQLARMMAQAAIPLDIRLVVLAASEDDGAVKAIPDVMIGSPDDPVKVRELAEACDVLTFDHELVDPGTLAQLQADGHVVWPSAETMALAQNKQRQREELSGIGLPVPGFREIATADEVSAFANEYAWPVVIKAIRGGYDGRGVWIVADADDAGRVIGEAHAAELSLMAEQYLELDLELAVVTARRPNGDIAVWEPVETVQRDGMCNELVVPVAADPKLLAEAVSMARKIVRHTEAVGVMAIEFFVSRGELYINELAPRPHNSGHWTIEGSATSQFEQHLRAVLDLPLGDTQVLAPVVATENLLGPMDGSDPTDRLAPALAVRGANVHLYGKVARPGRKLGHVTVLGEERGESQQRAKLAVRQLSGEQAAGGAR